jgi:hypothetical protein
MSGINSLAASGINVASLFGSSANSGGIDTSILYAGTSGTGTSVYGAGDVGTALRNAGSNEVKQLAATAKQPDVQRSIARYEKVLASAKTIDDVLNDPVAREVLLKANGLGDQVDNIGLAKKALASDPNVSTSLANKLSSVNGAWLDFAKKYDIANNGLSHLRASNVGFTGDWKLTIQRDGKAATAALNVTKSKDGGYSATIDGAPIGVKVTGDTLNLVYIWKDSKNVTHTTSLTGKVGKDGSLSGGQANDSATATSTWTATPKYAAAVKEVTDNYIGEKRLDMLDQQLPGLGTAILFKQVASTLDTPLKILGSAIGREVITTALNIPKQIAVQSIEAQEKVVAQRMDAKKLADPKFVDQLVQRYLLNLNGGTAGVTA